MSKGTGRCRVWLVMRPVEPNEGRPVEVRDDLMRHWLHGEDDRYHTPDRRHHATWHELRAHTDLVEVSR